MLFYLTLNPKPSSMPLFKLFLLPILIVFGWSAMTTDQPKGAPSEQLTTSNFSTQDIFRYMRCHRQAKNIVVTWGMTSLSGIDHFVVYHSEDNDFFDDVDVIPVENGELKYSYKHTGIYPGYHYYYVAAVRIGAPPVNSITDVVRIVAH